MSTLLKKRVVDPVLTNIARGFNNSSHVATKLFPIVTVSKEGGKIPLFTKYWGWPVRQKHESWM